ncbi:MAG: hypothetical protein GW858_05635 [Sphingomonadales bacterium]|nr:hypothetical protein [Sphingomonadales bacterium]NCQ21376.1 hypothetical protein [Sphingomonadales bacterium]NCT03539.1 hypothetical protein [Sphingomonadales bacterium]
MTDHPSTFKGTTTQSGELAWQDRASILPASQQGQVPGGGTPLLRGSFADMIRHMAALPDKERQGYVIAKAGDREYTAEEAMELASHPDFPSQGFG